MPSSSNTETPKRAQETKESIWDIWDYSLGLAGYLTTSDSPVQVEGSIAGRPFYFRARGQHWSLAVAGDPYSVDAVDIEQNMDGGDRYWEEDWGVRQFDASYMPHSEALRLVRRCAEAYVAEFDLNPPWMLGLWGTVFSPFAPGTVHAMDRKRFRRLSPKHLMFECIAEDESYLTLGHPAGTFRVDWKSFWLAKQPRFKYSQPVEHGSSLGVVEAIRWRSPDILYEVQFADRRLKIPESELRASDREG